MSADYYTADELETLTGTPASTWRYWAKYHPERGPASTKIGRRLVWRKMVIHEWLDALEEAGNG